MIVPEREQQIRHIEGFTGQQGYPPHPVVGLEYRCTDRDCDHRYTDPNSARKHERVTGHQVERTDWYRPDYLGFLAQREQARQARRVAA